MYYVNQPQLADKPQTPGAVRRMVKAGTVTEETLICEVGQTEWVPASYFERLWIEDAAIVENHTNRNWSHEIYKQPEQKKPAITIVAQFLFKLSLVAVALCIFLGIVGDFGFFYFGVGGSCAVTAFVFWLIADFTGKTHAELIHYRKNRL